MSTATPSHLTPKSNPAPMLLMSIVSETVPRFPPWRCPSCGAAHAPIHFDDGETIDLPEDQAALRNRIHATLNRARCPSCGDDLDVLEIVVRHPAADGLFVADNYWTVARSTLHRVEAIGLRWHYVHGQGVTFAPHGTADWIGRHLIGPLSHPAEDEAQDLLTRLAPRLATWSPPDPRED